MFTNQEDMIMSAVNSYGIWDSTLMQSEENLKTGWPFPGLRDEVAFLTSSSVTLFTSLRLFLLIFISILLLIISILSASWTEL